jgi:hypothetical protein
MALIKSFRVVPPGGWRYVQPDTATRFFADFSYDDLRAQVLKHREYKGLPVDTIDQDIQRQMCEGLSCDHCKPEPGETYTPVRDLTSSLTTEMAVRLGTSVTKALTKFILGGLEFVPKAEAEARAAICRSCPFNKPASLCSCSSVYGMVEKLIPADRKEIGVSVCMACGCSLQAKVNLPADVIQASLAPDTVLPKWCWQRTPGTPLTGSGS